MRTTLLFLSFAATLAACTPAPSEKAAGTEGAFCGGIAAFPCNEGLVCRLDGAYPDAGGTCVRP